MNILMIRLKPHKATIGLQHVMVCEPLELEYLASNHQSDAQVTIIDMILEKRSLATILKKHHPHVVVFSGYITLVGIIKEAGQLVKSLHPSCKVVVGGVHAEVNPQDFVSPHIDYIINTNGLKTFKQLVAHLNELTTCPVDAIEGLYKPGRKVAVDQTFDFNPPDRQRVSAYRHKYYYMFHQPCALIKTSFGCPYDCAFCFCKTITQNAYYQRDTTDVLDELASITEQEVYIVDDNFLFDQFRLKAFIAGLRSRGIDKRYLVYGRADFIANHPDLMADLYQVGLRAVIVGLESHTDDALNTYNKQSSKALNEQAVKVLQANKIEVYATLIIPMDFKAKDFKALEIWLNSLDLTFVNLQPLTPLKGTDIYDAYKDHFTISEDTYEKWDLAHVVLKPQYLSIRQYYYYLLKTYYRVVMPPHKTWRLIKTYGLKANMKMLVGSSRVSWQYIKKMIRG